MGIAKEYIKKIHEELAFYASWMPSQVLALGDYGTMNDDGAFVPLGNVSALGFRGLTSVAEKRPDDIFEVSAEEGTSVTVKAAGIVLPGSTLATADAGITFSFAKANALVCKLQGAMQESVTNLGALGSFVVQQHNAGKWKKDWRVVTQRIVAAGTTIVYSATDNAALEVSAKSPVKDIADASLGFSVVRKTGGMVNVVGMPDLAPFMTLMKLRRRFFRQPDFGAAAPAWSGDDPALERDVPA